MTSTWIIRDWMGNDMNLFGQKEFNSFGEARDEIQRFADDVIGEGRKGESEESIEERKVGICEDLYAVNVDENGKELEDKGQYTV